MPRRRLTETEILAIRELGTFRMIDPLDLSQHVYRSSHEAERSLRHLVRLRLVSLRTFAGPEAAPRELATLTREGLRLLHRNRIPSRDQAVYCGFVRPKEANHDADLYRLYQKESARIQQEGGRVSRVVLDYELKRKINRDIARLGASARREIAERHGLRVVGKKIPVPDMRIEYQTATGEMARVNLELVTEHYRGRHVSDKVKAGFSLYTPHGEADHLHRMLDQHELTADILSL